MFFPLCGGHGSVRGRGRRGRLRLICPECGCLFYYPECGWKTWVLRIFLFIVGFRSVKKTNRKLVVYIMMMSWGEGLRRDQLMDILFVIETMWELRPAKPSVDTSWNQWTAWKEQWIWNTQENRSLNATMRAKKWRSSPSGGIHPIPGEWRKPASASGMNAGLK